MYICNMQGQSEFKKLRNGPPTYLPMLQELFEDVAVDGSTAYAPGDGSEDHNTNSSAYVQGDEQYEEYVPDDDIFEVPQENSPRTSSGMKRSQSQSTTGKSPVKKSRSPIVSCFNNFLHNTAKSSEHRNMLLADRNRVQMEVINKEEQKKMADVDRIYTLAVEAGVDKGSDEYFALAFLAKDPEMKAFFMKLETAEQRIRFIQSFIKFKM